MKISTLQGDMNVPKNTHKYNSSAKELPQTQNPLNKSSATFTAQSEIHNPRGLSHAIHSLTSGDCGLGWLEEYLRSRMIAAIFE